MYHPHDEKELNRELGGVRSGQEQGSAGPEGLGLGGLGVPHDVEPIVEGLEGDYLVVPHPEPLPPSGEVDVLGREAQEE